MNSSDVTNVKNTTLAYIKVNEELMDEYFIKLKETVNEKEVDKLLKLLKVCKKNILIQKNFYIR